jgi:hypothetical protein
MPYFTEPEEALDYVHALLDGNKATLGLGYVGYGEERLLPKYPAAVVSFNVPVNRELHATRTFRLEWVVQIEVYHAKLTVGHKTRTREDMQLAARIRNKLHEDYTFGGSVVFGFVRSERPGIIADGKGRANVATILVWSGESRAAL